MLMYAPCRRSCKVIAPVNLAFGKVDRPTGAAGCCGALAGYLFGVSPESELLKYSFFLGVISRQSVVPFGTRQDELWQSD